MKRRKSAYLAAALAMACWATLWAEDAGQSKPKRPFEEARAKLIGAIPPTQPEAFESVPNDQGDYVYRGHVRQAPGGRNSVQG